MKQLILIKAELPYDMAKSFLLTMDKLRKNIRPNDPLPKGGWTFYAKQPYKSRLIRAINVQRNKLKN